MPGRGKRLIALGAIALLAPASAAAAGQRYVRCDYATAAYRIRELPFLGGIFSPSSRRLAFADGGVLKAYRIAGRQVKPLYSPSDGGPPVSQVLQWTPRGIFFTRGAATSGRPAPDADPNRVAYGQVWVVRADGSGPRQVRVRPPADAGTVEYGVPHVSPNGRWVGYSFLTNLQQQAGGEPINGWRLAVARIAYAPSGRVTFRRPRFLTDDSYYNEAKDWSGDSRLLDFASTRGEGDDRRALNSDAFAISPRTGHITRITRAPTWEEAHDLLRGDLGPRDADAFISDRDTPNPETSPYYSTPDLIPNAADSVLVATSVLALASWTSHQLFVSGPEGDRGWVRRLTFDYDNGNGWVARVPVWSPNGRYIRFDEWRAHGATALGQRERLLIFDCPARRGRG